MCGGNVHPPPCHPMQTCNPKIFLEGDTAYHRYSLVSITPSQLWRYSAANIYNGPVNVCPLQNYPPPYPLGVFTSGASCHRL